MNKYSIVSLILCSILIYSCSSYKELFYSDIEKIENDSLIVYMQDNQTLNGKYKLYLSPQKSAYQTFNLKNGRINGSKKVFFKTLLTGSKNSYYLAEEIEYKNGVKNGFYKKYDEFGKLDYSVNYINGKKESLEIDNFGNPTTTNYKNGLKNGLEQTKDEKGNVIYTVNYKKNKKEGEEKTYHYNGKLRTITNYVNGLKTGKSIKYQSNGIIETVNNYVNDTLDGYSLINNPDGTKNYEAYFKMGKKHGCLTLYKSKIKSKSITCFKNGIKHGLAERYHKNDSLHFKINYINGLREGKVILYNPEGEIYRTVFYKKDSLINN